MYDWSRSGVFMSNANKFQLLLKGCTIEASWTPRVWPYPTFQLLLKGCTIEAWKYVPCRNNSEFQLLLKGCTIEADIMCSRVIAYVTFQLLLKGCTIEARRLYIPRNNAWSFSCCWKDVRLKHTLVVIINEKTVCFSCCWKDVRLKPVSSARVVHSTIRFSCCWKDVRLKLATSAVCNRVNTSFSCCWKDVRLKLLLAVWLLAFLSFSCCWKDVRLKPVRQIVGERVNQFQLLLKGCTIEAPSESFVSMSRAVSVVVERMYDWSCRYRGHDDWVQCVSVVVERMYDWSSWEINFCSIVKRFQLLLKGCTIEAFIEARRSNYFRMFQLLLKGCTIEACSWRARTAWNAGFSCCWKDVRLKQQNRYRRCDYGGFQLLLKGCTIEARRLVFRGVSDQFQLLLKGCTIEAKSSHEEKLGTYVFQLLLKGCTIEAYLLNGLIDVCACFSCCWKDVRLKLRNQLIENKWFLTVGFWSVFRKWSICTKSAIIFENLGWFGWLLDCFW